jgi:hypothetical protein
MTQKLEQLDWKCGTQLQIIVIQISRPKSKFILKLNKVQIKYIISKLELNVYLEFEESKYNLKGIWK